MNHEISFFKNGGYFWWKNKIKFYTALWEILVNFEDVQFKQNIIPTFRKRMWNFFFQGTKFDENYRNCCKSCSHFVKTLKTFIKIIQNIVLTNGAKIMKIVENIVKIIEIFIKKLWKHQAVNKSQIYDKNYGNLCKNHWKYVRKIQKKQENLSKCYKNWFKYYESCLKMIKIVENFIKIAEYVLKIV